MRKRHTMVRLTVVALSVLLIPVSALGAQVPLFAFHNQIGLNLHHFLYWKAHPHSRETGEVADWPADLGEQERGAIDRALAYYEKAFEKQDLLFGDELYEIKIELAKHDGSDAFSGLELETEHVRRGTSGTCCCSTPPGTS